MSSKLVHGKLEWRLAAQIDAWAGEHGEVAVEWRCYLMRDDKRPSSLIPDVAYMSYERLSRDLPSDARQRPRIAPDIVVEIWSPGDREKTMREKVALYFAHGTRVVVVLYPAKREIMFYHGETTTTSPARGIVCVPGYDDLTLDADALFRDV